MFIQCKVLTVFWSVVFLLFFFCFLFTRLVLTILSKRDSNLGFVGLHAVPLES